MNSKLFLFALLLVTHIVLLQTTNIYITPELVFPVWIYSNAQNFVSEVQSLYPPALPYLVTVLYSLTSNMLLSVNVIQLTFIVLIDSLLFLYLLNKFNFKIALIGFLFYIPWQVFFRGNYLWFDLATIPFLLGSFIYFEKFTENFKTKNLALASVLLSAGYLFKATVLWVYILYVYWLVYLVLTNKKGNRFFFHFLLLLTPLFLTATINFLTLSVGSSFQFSFYWHILMQNFVYPRISALSRFVEPEYFSVMILLLIVYFSSIFAIEKLSKLNFKVKMFLYSFTAVSLLNIYPRWSDFHAQPFLVFLTILFVYAVSNTINSKNRKTIYLKGIYMVFAVFSIVILGNRIRLELETKSVSTQDYISGYTSKSFETLIKNRDVFAYDSPLYNGNPVEAEYSKDSYKNVNLALYSPDQYYQTTSWQIALTFIRERKPGVIVIPYQIHDKISGSYSLTALEKYIDLNYRNRGNIDDIYYVYSKK